MDELQKIFKGEGIGGEYEDFKKLFVNDEKNQREFYDDLKKEQKTDLGYDQFKSKYFTFTPVPEGEKKKTTPEQGVGSPVSQPQSKTASVVTPQSKPAVSPALGGNTPVAQPPVAKVGTAETIAYDEALAQKAAHEKKRSETIASVAMGLERNFGPNKFLKTKIEGILADETKSQDERDVLALEEAYNTYKNAGYKRGGKAIKETATEQSFSDRLARKDSPQIVLETDADELLRALGDAEANMRKNDPQAWQRKMNKESDTYYKTRGVKNGDQQAMYSAITRQLTGFAEGGLMEKEADLRMQAKELGGFMGKMDQRFGANPNDPERSEMLAKKSDMLKQADELRNMRHKEQLATIDALKKRLDDPSITDFELKAGREALRRAEQEERGFFDPTYQIQAATEANKEEIAIANEGENGGKTPQERIQRYFTSLLAEERRLNGRISGDATNTQAAIEQLSGVIPGGGREWTPDELRYKQVREKIRSLAPIVYLNEADVSREGGVKPALRNFGEIMTGGGVIGADLGLESPQARAGNITEAMIVSGLDPQKAMSINYKEAIDKNVQGYGLGDPQYWMEQAGMVGGILIQAIPGTMVTRGLGAEALIAKMGKAITSTTKAGKALKILANTSANALKRGVEFEISGQASPNNYEELNFASGLLGGVGESMGKGVLKTGEKLIGKLFGDQAQQAYGLIARYGGEKTGLGNAGGFVQGRAAMGIGESFGESTESLVHAWQKSEPGHDFWEGMKEEFGDTFDENVKFFVSTFMLGLALGGGNQGGIASGLMDSAREQYAAATPEQQEVMDQVLEDTGSGLEDAHTQAMQESETEWLREQEAEFKEKIDKGNLSVEEGAAAQQSIDAIRKRLSEIESSRAVGLNPTPEDVASVEAEQEGIEPEKKKEPSKVSITTKESEQGISGDIVIEGKPEGHFNVAIEGDQAHLADIQIGYDEESGQAMRGKGYGTEAYVQIGDQLAEQGVTLTSTNFGESQTSISPQALSVWEKLVKEGRARITGQIEGKVVDRFTGKESVETINTYEFIPSKDAVSPAADVSMETVEDVNGVASEVPGMSAEEIASITEMMANVNSMGDAFIEEADVEESPVELNAVPDTQEEINQRRGKQQSAPATDESIVDVTGEAPTPIAAEETVVATEESMLEVNAVPDTRKKNEKAVAGGKSKPKANPNRKTKSKPVADLTPTEVVSEAIAVSAEVDENPTTENKEREAQIEQQIENNVVSPAPEVPKEISDLYAEAATLRFTVNALGMQMGGKTLVGKAKAEFDRTSERLAAIEKKLSEYESSKKEKAVEQAPKKEATKQISEPAMVDSDYGNYLLDEIEAKLRQRDGDEEASKLRAGLAKGFTETVNDRGEARAISNLESIYVEQLDKSVRADAYRAIRDSFTRLQEEKAKESPTVTQQEAPAPKPKKSRGKEKPLPEGVEAQFTQVSRGGRKTQWKKENGKWFYRNHKPGTSISGNEFDSDWKAAEGKDIARAEKMSEMEPLKRDAINAVQDWLAAWNDFIITRPGLSGTRFAVDPKNPGGKGGATAEDIRKITEATFKAGIAIANLLASQGKYTYDNWRAKMEGVFGDHVKPWLKTAWNQVSHVLPEGSTSADIQSNVVEGQTGEEANEKSKDVKKKSGRQATVDTMREFSGTNPAALNAALAAVDDTYEVMSIKGIFTEALAAVKKAGGFANPDVWADLLSEKEGEARVLHHAKRMLAIRFYGELADQIQERMGDEATQEEMEAFEKAVSNMEVALDLVKNNNTWSGQQTSMMSEWRMVMANTVGYAKSKIDKYNEEILKSPKKGKAIRRKAKEAKEQLNDIREQEGTTIDAAAAVDAAITDVENGTTPKAKKTREGGKPKTRIVKALGLNLEQANAMMEQARADMARAAREGFAGSMGSPAVFSFANALGRYGVAVMAKGAITFKEWAAKIKGDLPNVTDQQLQEAWDTHEHEGKTLAQHSKEALAAAAAAPVKRTEARKQSLRGKIRGAINDHFKKGAEPMTLEERLLAIKDEAGNQLLTEDEAAHIYETVKDEFEARVKAKVEARAKALKRKPKKESKPAKTDSQRAIEAMVDGEFTDEMVQEIFADRLGLIQQMTTEQVKTARALGKALDSTKPNTRSEAQAAMALDRFMYEILPPPSNGELFGELFKSIIYANMLMGIPTHLKNLITSGAMTVTSFVETAANVSKWKRAVRVAIKKGKETGDWSEASWLFLQASPITELAVKTQALARGWSKGARIAWDIMKSGYIDSKYIDQGKAKLGRLSPILERHRFGKYNPANVFKYVGRALSAEDAWMYSINNEMELADATRRHFLDGKAGGPMTLTRDVSRRMAKSNPLYADSLKEAEADIDKISDALQMTPAEKARAIKIRAREILIDKIGLTEDEVQQAEDTARSRIFTLKRNGLWGKTATLMTKINNTKGIGKVSWIWMPFANIIGNLGDTFNDYYPGYGILRANGVSPTALTQMLGRNKESAMMSEPVQAEGTMDWIKKTMGGRQDQRYYEQMGRAWLGSMMMLTAMMLMDDDDKDDFIQFTGKNDPTHKNYLKIGGVPIISWELIPSIAPVAAIMSEAHSFHKLHPKEERSFGRRMLYAMGAVEQSVAGLSVAESVQNLNQVVGTALSSLTGVGNYGDPVDFEKGITTLGTELGKSGIGMLSRVNPLTNPLVGQIQQIFDPRVFSHSTIEQSMEYAALGATYRYTKDAEGNDRIAGVDIFGEEIKRLPSEDSFGFLSMFANEKAKDPRWKFLADHGGLEVMSRTTNANILFEDDEEKYGVVSRKMTDKQYGTYAKLAGQKFSKELTKYMNGNQWKKDYDTVVMGTAGTMTKLQEEVKKMASEARTKAKDEMDRMPESKGGFGGTRIGTKTYVKP